MAIDVERLIECVKTQVFLYDLGHKDYKNTSRKAAVWEDIADELNENSETVKLKWKTVRDGYIKYKKQQKDCNAKKGIHYIWSNHLRFLDDYQVTRKSKSKSVTVPTTLQLSEDEGEPVSQSYSPGSMLVPSPSDSVPLRKEKTPRRKKTDNNRPSNFLDSNITKKVTQNYDATDHLFLSYSETFKTFSPRQQALLKVELAKLFSSAELNSLQNAENLQEQFVAGSSPSYAISKNDECGMDAQDVHTVDEDSDDDDIEFVSPEKRTRRKRNGSDTTE